MEYKNVLRVLAPCGLDCGRCADYAGGEIKTLAGRLLEQLGNYARVAVMKADGKPEFKGYGQFEAVLKSFAGASCDGCRGETVTCPLDTCRAKDCIKEKPVDFCFQCADYPCGEQFQGMPLRKRWTALNDRMKEIGVEAFYQEQLKTPRYPGKVS